MSRKFKICYCHKGSWFRNDSVLRGLGMNPKGLKILIKAREKNQTILRPYVDAEGPVLGAAAAFTSVGNHRAPALTWFIWPTAASLGSSAIENVSGQTGKPSGYPPVL